MAAFNKFNIFTEHLAEGVHNLQSNTLRVALTNVAPSAANVSAANLTQISYSTLVGGVGTGRNLSVSTSAQTGGVYKLVIQDKVLTASAQTASFRYVVLQNTSTTSPTNALIGWYDYGQSIRLNAAETFTIDFDSSNGVLTIT